MSVETYKPWLDESDASDVFFSSINLYAEERFYPCTGNDSVSSTAEGDALNVVNIALTPVGPGPWDRG
jgi:acetoin utilization deacetylase AcuC-like enzyme